MARKKKGSVDTFDAKKRFKNVKVLIDTGRSKEAIAYMYLLYNDLVKSKHNKPRLPYQTIREYGIICVNELEHNPESTYAFLKKIEDIIYGGIEPTSKEFDLTIQLFSNLYKDITGSNFSYSL